MSEKSSKSGFFRRQFSMFRRISSHASGYDFIRTQGDAIQDETRGIWSRFKDALRRPQTWLSMEELEHAWGIDDDNRHLVIRSLRLEMALFAIFIMAGVWQIFRWMDGGTLIGSFFPGVLLVFLGLVKGAIAAWRMDVLTHRCPVSFVQWIGFGARSPSGG